jgi:NTE family protein
MPRAAAWPLNLALQGGGAHGAFSWGVLDALLEDGRVQPAAVSGTSAGAMNALALAHGWMEGGAVGARAALARFWRAVAAGVPEGSTVVSADDALNPRLAPLLKLLMHWTHYLAPEHSNPLDINPLRDIVREQFDFERLRRECPLRLYIAATQANTGRLRLFREHELTADMIQASACLPALFRPVDIEGEPYWDGGYSANPPVLPLLNDGHAHGVRDTLLVLLMPRRYEAAPRGASQIRARTLDLAFSAPFLAEMRQLAHWQTQAQQRWLPLSGQDRLLRASRLHLVEGGDVLGRLDADSRLTVHLGYFEALRDLGRQRAQAWLAQCGAQPGPGVLLAELFA